MSGLIRMQRNAKNMTDASWRSFIYVLAYKAERAGRWLVEVESRGTTQNCSGCGKKVPKLIWVRTLRCPYCGLELDRGHNALLNILKRGLEKAGWEPFRMPAEVKPLLHLMMGQAQPMSQEAHIL